ncbi:EBP isomerase, partial [Pterocles burchelli]|nr:EBP isomerase [Pterocles burchelli]
MAAAAAAHPYWPRSLTLPGYVASARPGWQSAGAVAAAGAGLMAVGWAVGGARGGAERSPARRLALGWFLTCAGIHAVLEGYFSLRHRDLPADTGLLADVWKEYAKADSRYMTSDDFMVAMETVTAAAWGPLSFLTFLAFLRRHPARYVLQLIVSLGTPGAGGFGGPSHPWTLLDGVCPPTGQLYGDVLYFATEARVGWTHSDPHPFYFWGYFVGLNGIWVIIPGILLADACQRLAHAQRALD